MHDESQFLLKNIIISNTKFHHVIATLPKKEINKVVDIVRNPPAADPYGSLKAPLLQMQFLTDYACCESIMALLMSGDKLPSALLSKMPVLLPIDYKECLFLHYAFLRQLPAVSDHTWFMTILRISQFCLNVLRRFIRIVYRLPLMLSTPFILFMHLLPDSTAGLNVLNTLLILYPAFLSGCWFLVDHGASVSLFPAPNSSTTSRLTADGSTVS